MEFFTRDILQSLSEWAENPIRKPLILRGARQVGKTTVVKEFGKSYNQFIHLNLEKPVDAAYFSHYDQVKPLLEAIFFDANARLNESSTLIFIDEIQAEPKAISMLRYIYEEFPHYHVIAAGSLLESFFAQNTSFPVGRLMYKVLRPVSFSEYLNALGDTTALEALNTFPLPSYALNRLFDHFHRYALIGGMPEIVQTWIEYKDLTILKDLYDSILVTYLGDMKKYARNDNQALVLQHVIQNAFREAGDRIKFAGFGNSNYGSREIKEALLILEQAMLVKLIYPVTNSQLPLSPSQRKAPRLHVLDTGLLNYFSQIQSQFLGLDDLNTLYKGRITEHIVGQELLANSFDVMEQIHFWAREKKTSNAEVDYLFQHKGEVYPVEVKSGKSGRLRSLHLFMEQEQSPFAIRLYHGPVHVERAQTIAGKEFQLLNLPYFLGAKLGEYVDWMKQK